MKIPEFVIVEGKILDEYSINGVYAVSLVKNPAIELGWEMFSDKVPYFIYTASPEPDVIDDSHKFCKEHHGHVYHISEINNFRRNEEWIPESNYFHNFKGESNFNIDQQIFNCRHWFRRASLSEVPKQKLWMMNADNYVKFSVEDPYKHIISGVVMVSNKPILRLSINRGDGTRGPGYIVFTNSTVRQMQQKFGWNRSLTFKHRDVITGSATLLNSWIEEVGTDIQWKLSYHIEDDDIWNNYIKTKEVVGFSIEGIL